MIQLCIFCPAVVASHDGLRCNHWWRVWGPCLRIWPAWSTYKVMLILHTHTVNFHCDDSGRFELLCLFGSFCLVKCLALFNTSANIAYLLHHSTLRSGLISSKFLDLHSQHRQTWSLALLTSWSSLQEECRYHGHYGSACQEDVAICLLREDINIDMVWSLQSLFTWDKSSGARQHSMIIFPYGFCWDLLHVGIQP